MTAEELIRLLDGVPMDSKVYFRIPEEWSKDDEVCIEQMEYNNITKDVVLSWDAPMNHEEY